MHGSTRPKPARRGELSEPAQDGLSCCSPSAHCGRAQADKRESIARGKYLFQAADCSGCHGNAEHGSDPVGGLGLATPFGTFRAPNITPDKEHGIGAWSEDEFKTALRSGVGRHGEYLFPVFPYTSFTKLTDRDIADLYAYLMSLPPVPVANKPHQAKAPFGWRPLLVFWRELFFRAGALRPIRARGTNGTAEIISFTRSCIARSAIRRATCLGAIDAARSFSGNLGHPGGQNAPNITSDKATGIGSWSVEDIQRLLKTGMTPDSDFVGSGMKAVVRGTSKLTDADRRAIAIYLKSVPPIYVDLPPPTLGSQNK